MKLVKFTNAHPDHRDGVLYLNPEHIVAVFEQATEKGGSLSTRIFGTTGTQWTVEESLNEVLHKLQDPSFMLAE